MYYETEKNWPWFYKKDGENLLYWPNKVWNKDFELLKEKKDEYTYPVDGWYWFENEDEAKEFLGIIEETENKEII